MRESSPGAAKQTQPRRQCRNIDLNSLRNQAMVSDTTTLLVARGILDESKPLAGNRAKPAKTAKKDPLDSKRSDDGLVWFIGV